MPEYADDLIDRIVHSQVKFAVLKLFRENPYVMDNRPGLALWVGKPESLLAPELDELVEMGLVRKWGTEPGAIYAYTRNEDLRRCIDRCWSEISRRAQELRWEQEDGNERLGNPESGTEEA